MGIDIYEKRQHSFTIVYNHVLDDYLQQKKIDVFDFAVYATLCRLANNTTKISIPSVPKLAQRAGVSERKCQRCLQKLADLQLIETEERVNEHGGRTSNAYHVLPEIPHEGRGVVHGVHQSGVPGTPLLVSTVHPFYTQKELNSEELEEECAPAHDVQPPPKKSSPNGKKNGALEWPEEDLWLKKFLNEQQFIDVPKEQLLDDPKWWENVSHAADGLDQETLTREFAKMGAWLRETPKGRSRKFTKKGSVKAFIRHWLTR